MYDGLTSGWGLAFACSPWPVSRPSSCRPPRPARHPTDPIAAVTALVLARGLAQRPYALPTTLTIDQAAGDPNTMRWLVVVTIVAVLLIGPALALLYRLDLTDRLAADHDEDHRGVTQPMTAATDGGGRRRPGATGTCAHPRTLCGRGSKMSRMLRRRGAPPHLPIQEVPGVSANDSMSSGEPVIAWLERRTSVARARDVEFDDPKLEYRRLFSEVWGTFLLVLVAAGGGVVGATAFGGDLTLAMKALAPGMMVMGIIFFMGTISGAHLNPAVTLAFAVRGNFPWRRVPGYILAQVIGAVLASWFLQLMYGGIINGATEPTPEVSLWVAMLTEAVLTLGLVSVILGTASGARNVGINGAIAVGAYIGLVSVWGAPVSGASMNPARSLGPRADRVAI